MSSKPSPSSKSLAVPRPAFDTSHLLTFKTPQSSQAVPSPAAAHTLAGAYTSNQSSAASSPARAVGAQAPHALRSDMTSGALLQKLLTDERAVAAQNMSEIANRRDISILKLSEMCSFLRADLDSLEKDNAQLSAALQTCEIESQQLRLHIASMSKREVVFSHLESQHARLREEFAELRAQEQSVSLSLRQTQLERDNALQQLSKCKLQTAAASESARHAAILMQAMEADLASAERCKRDLHESLASCALERDGLRQRLSLLQSELEAARHSDAQSSIQIDALKENFARSQECQSRCDSDILQLRQELQRQQQLVEELAGQVESGKALARAKEEEYTTLQSLQNDELVSLRSQAHSNQLLVKEQQNEISELMSARNVSRSTCQELQLKITTLEVSHADVSDALQAQIAANARSAAEIRDLRCALETKSSKQREHFENELRSSSLAQSTLQIQLESAQQQSSACAALCSSQQQSIDELLQKLERCGTERAAMEMQIDSIRSGAQKHEAAYARLSQDTGAQISQLSGQLKESRAKNHELQLALSSMTSRYNDISGALSKAAADLEFKDLELKSTIKQARTKSLQQAESQSQLEDQHLQLQHEFNETSARLQQQLQVAEQSAASRDSRIMALEEALTGNWFNAMRLYA